MLRTWMVGLVAALAAGCGTFPAAPSAAIAQLAPSGTLRAAINFGNPILATRAADGSATGVSVDLARELARRLGVGVELIPYQAAGRVVEGVKTMAWDIAFVAIDPLRGNEIDYSAAYEGIEGAYLVRRDSPIQSNAEVDRPGIRVAAARGSAYDLFLSRELRQARIVHVPTSPVVTETFLAQNLEAADGVRQQLEADARRLPGLRLLDGRFMVINQAMGVPKGRPEGLTYLRGFVEEMKSSGFVARALERHRIEGATVASAAGN